MSAPRAANGDYRSAFLGSPAIGNLRGKLLPLRYRLWCEEMTLDYQKDVQATDVVRERVTKKGPQHTDPRTKESTGGVWVTR